jgi:hypothetical protein
MNYSEFGRWIVDALQEGRAKESELGSIDQKRGRSASRDLVWW